MGNKYKSALETQQELEKNLSEMLNENEKLSEDVK